MANRSNHRVGISGFITSRRIARGHAPHRPRRIIDRGSDFCFETNMPAQIVLIRQPLHVFPQLVTPGKMVRPIVVRLKRQRVKMVWRIDPAAGIRVLQPGAADRLVLLVNDERNAGLLQLDRHAETGHAGTDDHHAKRRQRLVGRPRAPVHRFGIVRHPASFLRGSSANILPEPVRQRRPPASCATIPAAAAAAARCLVRRNPAAPPSTAPAAVVSDPPAPSPENSTDR